MNTYTANNLVKLGFSVIRKDNSTPIDPDTLVAKIQMPGNVAPTDLTPDIIRAGTGVYYVDYDIPNVEGFYTYEWIGTGNLSVAEVGQFYVKPSTF